MVTTLGTSRWDTKRQDERQFQQKPDTRGIKHSCQWEITVRKVASGWDRTSMTVFSGQGSVQTLGIYTDPLLTRPLDLSFLGLT